MIDYLRGLPYAVALMAQLDRERRRVSITPHVLFEAYRGAIRSKHHQAAIERVRATVGTLSFDHHAAREAVRMSEALAGEGVEIPIGDLFIGACTIVWGDCEIVTRDVRQFAPLRGFGLHILPIV